jgi:ElaB/YqjD/DUF883 family membrane-anchored ribosome-binding protein
MEVWEMSEFDDEVKKAEEELNGGLAPVEPVGTDEFLGDLRTHAEEYGQQVKDAASRAFDFANEKWARAEDKFREISDKDPRELVEDAKEFARQKPGQTILISAAVGLVLGLLLSGSRKR